MPPKSILHLHLSGLLVAGLAGALSACSGADAPLDAGASDAGTSDAGIAPRDAGVADSGPVDTGPSPFAPVAEALSGTPPSDPAGRWGAWTVHAATQGRLYQFGGSFYPRAGVGADGWVYDLETGVWSALASTGDAPAGRYCLCATYLPEHEQILWVGGRDTGGPLPVGAWTLDLTNHVWSEVTDGDLPAGVVGCQATWFPPGGYALVFGGDGRSGLISRSHRYDPELRRFEAMNLPSRPPGRRDAMMAYDPSSMQIVLHGGAARIMPQNTSHFDDTWLFDGAGWQPLATTGGPPPGRRWGAFALDAARRQFVLFSGTEETADFEDLWTLDLETATWTEHTGLTLPAARAGAGHAFVPEHDALYIFGGLQSPDYRALDDGWRLRFGP